MLLWEIIVRDAERIMSSPDAAWEWFSIYAPGMWAAADDEPRTRREADRAGGHSRASDPIDKAFEEFEETASPRSKRKVWNRAEWKECRNCVQTLLFLRGLARVPKPFRVSALNAANKYLDQHTRKRFVDSADGPAYVTQFVDEDGEPACFYHGDAHPNDSPGAFWAYVFASTADQQVTPLEGGGRCESPDCGRIIGFDTRGKPRTGLCGRCKAAKWRSENLDLARERAAASMKKSRKQKRRKNHTTDSKGE